MSFEGRVTAFTYDNTAAGQGRLIEKRFYASEADYNNGAGTPGRTVSYSSDGYGRTVEVDDSAHGITTNTYDAAGRLIQIASPEGIVNHAYDDVTGQTIRTWTSKTTAGTDAVTDTRYGYDGLGRLTDVTVVERTGALEHWWIT